MIYYIMLHNPITGDIKYIEHYDAESKELITTEFAEDRQEYLSKESLMEELSNLIDNPEIVDNYRFDIGAY